MRYDPLIVHYLADELRARLAGAAARAIWLERAALRAALETSAGTLLLDLHPTRGAITLGAATPGGARHRLARGTRVAGVDAPADERLLRIELAGGPPGAPTGIVLELLTNQWNVLVENRAQDAGRRIVGVLRARQAGRRALRVGAGYEPPPPSRRAGVEAPLAREAWHALLGGVPPPERAARLVAQVAWTSPINAGAILGPAVREAGPEALDAAYERYRALAARPDPAPRLLESEGQPYPLALPSVAARAAPSLLDAMSLAGGAAPPAAAAAIDPALLAALRARLARLDRRRSRLQAQVEDAPAEALALRARADLLLARLERVHKGMDRIRLPDFAGGEVEIRLDPALTPAGNARRLYEEARRRERAAARVPGLVARGEAERARLAALLRRVESGDAGPEEARALAGEPARSRQQATAPRLPYRCYRTSGGLEVRVGRSRRDNDELTLHRSAPNDIWLHARDAGGAHVILRWTDPSGSPPRRDLVEAATLAALHSRARTSGTVAVDWTRRKYVRKPRRSPPGLVVPERVRTIFVEPIEAVEHRLREGPTG